MKIVIILLKFIEKENELYRKKLYEKINSIQSQMTMRRNQNNLDLKRKILK